MKEKYFTLFGVFGPMIAIISIGLSIWLSPWFSWQNNALSDLGHASKSEVAPILNIGLILTGFFLIVYAVTTFRKHAKYTSSCLVISSMLLQLVATFDEVYGFFHIVVSVFFFISIGITLVVYAYEKRSTLGVIAFLVGLNSWILYELKIFSIAVAVPEIISSITVSLLFVYSTIKIYFEK